jgi:hypothetical protein
MSIWLDKLVTLPEAASVQPTYAEANRSVRSDSSKKAPIGPNGPIGSGIHPENEALPAAIAACLSVHAECVEKLGTEFPEQLPSVSPTLRDKITRQRERVTLSLSGVDPSVHVAHLESLTTGLRLILNRLAPPPPVPAKPPTGVE